MALRLDNHGGNCLLLSIVDPTLFTATLATLIYPYIYTVLIYLLTQTKPSNDWSKKYPCPNIRSYIHNMIHVKYI